jgi:uncharacterized protein YegP (UPF0339 family)
MVVGHSGAQARQIEGGRHVRFVIYKNASGAFWWVLKGANGETMATSETMTRKQSCEDSIASIKKGAAGAPTVDMTT